MELRLSDWIVDLAQDAEAIPRGPGHACPYLPGREARERAFLAEALEPGAYHRLMELGWRRSGRVLYRAACDGCAACEAIRVPVADFRPTRSQRRAWRRNADVRVEVGRPTDSEDRHRLFARYLESRHDRSMSGTFEEFSRFLCESPVDTLEMSYWLGESLVGVGIVDACPASLSTVYFYFDPAQARRSLGVFSTLWEIDYARRRSIPHYYLGYYVRDARTMRYKSQFCPHERRQADGVWRRFEKDTEVGS